MKNRRSVFFTSLVILFMLSSGCRRVVKTEIQYIRQFEDENHPEIAYWFLSPDLLSDEKYLSYLDNVADKSLYTLLFLTAREGADFYNYKLMHPIFQKLVAEGHRKGLKIGLQIWGNNKNVSLENSVRMIVADEITLDKSGSASLTAKARFIRFPKRILKMGLYRVYVFRKTSEGFYDPATLRDITEKCQTIEPDTQTVRIIIKGDKALSGLTACVMTQEFCRQSSQYGADEINRFAEAINAYADIPFDGFALDEYGNKFVARVVDMKPGEIYRGLWYSLSMDEEYRKTTGQSLDKLIFNVRYAPENHPDVRMKAINDYMDFMRTGALRVENAVYQKSKQVFGKSIFNGIHDTYHNSLINDEIWANGLAWWNVPREYGQTDEKTPTPTRLGIAMAHPMNAMYNQYYDKELEPVLVKALHDLRYGIRTHYHALNDKRPLRYDLDLPDAVENIDKIERCTRLLNKFNPSLPQVNLLVIFGMEALSNWYPDEKVRGVYDINDKLNIEEKCLEIWKAGYVNALVPSDVIINNKLSIGTDGKPVMNGHKYDAILYLYPQYAREPVLKFLEDYERKGGKLMLEGSATRDFSANDISSRFHSIEEKATVLGYSVDKLPDLGIQKNFLNDGCINEDGSYVFTDMPSLRTPAHATFNVKTGSNTFTGVYKGLAIIGFDMNAGLTKFAAAGFSELRRNGKVILNFKNPVDIYITRQNGRVKMVLADSTQSVKPLINKL